MLIIGITEEQFWNGNPRLLKPYKEAHNLREKQRADESDYIAWLHGLYSTRAFEVPLSHFASGLSRKHSDAKYYEKPLNKLNKEKTAEGLTDEEKRKQVDFLFSSLALMKTNFELTKQSRQEEGSGE